MTNYNKAFKVKHGLEITAIAAAETTATSTATGKVYAISDNGGKLSYYSTTASDWLYVGTEAVVYTPPPPPPEGPPVTDYIALYDYTSVDGSSLNDLTANANTATISGTVTITTSTGNGASESFSVMAGSNNETISFPSGLLDADGYTLIHVTRRVSGNGRIMTAPAADNWFSGHWQDKAGIAFHNGWLAGQDDIYGTNWVISVDQQYFYRPNGDTDHEGTAGGGLIPSVIGINLNSNEKTSSWQLAEVIVYDRELSGAEIESMESYYGTKYGITLGA
jgi:hypothetical protein